MREEDNLIVTGMVNVWNVSPNILIDLVLGVHDSYGEHKIIALCLSMGKLYIADDISTCWFETRGLNRSRVDPWARATSVRPPMREVP